MGVPWALRLALAVDRYDVGKRGADQEQRERDGCDAVTWVRCWYE